MRIFRPNIPAMERNHDIEGLARVLFEDSEDELRTEAGKAIGRTKGPNATRLLLQGLKSSDVRTRIWAAWCLGIVKDPSSISALIDATKDPYQDAAHRYPVREQAAKALEAMPSQDMRGSMAGQSVAQLIETVSFGTSSIRAIAAEALGHTRDKRAFEPLVRLLSSGDLNLQTKAIAALGKLGDVRAIPYLLRQQVTSRSAYYADQPLKQAICEIGADGIVILADALANGETDPVFVVDCFGLIGSPKAISYILPWLENDNEELQITAIQALGCIVAPESIRALLHMLDRVYMAGSQGIQSRRQDARSTGYPRRDKNVVLQSVIEALGKLRASEAVPSLIVMLNSGDGEISLVTIKALANIGDSRAISPIARLIPNIDDAGQEIIAGALGKINGDESVPILINLLGTGTIKVQSATLKAMQQQQRSQYVSALNNLKSSQDLELNQLVLETLEASHGDPVPKLKRMMRDRHANARLLAISTCIKSRISPDKVDCEMLLLDAEFEVRWGAASLLWLCGVPMENYNLAAALREVSLTDRRYLKRYFRAREILTSGEPRAISALVNHLGHNDVLVRKGASKVLLQLGKIAEPLLAKALENSNVRIRRRAAEVLSEMPRFHQTIHQLFRVEALMPSTRVQLQQMLSKERDRDIALMMQKALNQ